MLDFNEADRPVQNSNKTDRRQRSMSASKPTAVSDPELNSPSGELPTDLRFIPRSAAKVSVKRKRTLDRASMESGTSSDAATIEPQPERQPRVFRVQQPVVDHGLSSGSEHAIREAADIPSIPAIPTRPPRRRTPPAVVTKFGIPSEASNRADDSITDSTSGAPQGAEALARQLREVDVVLTQIREAQRFHFMPPPAAGTDGRRTFKTVNTEIGQLREQAEHLRRKEAASVVEWIRNSIALYGLTQEDLLA
jgi:hypothetical protein